MAWAPRVGGFVRVRVNTLVDEMDEGEEDDVYVMRVLHGTIVAVGEDEALDIRVGGETHGTTFEAVPRGDPHDDTDLEWYR